MEGEIIDLMVTCFCMGAVGAFGALFAVAAISGLKRILKKGE